MDESGSPLPGRCTDIVTQKKKKERVSLFIEGAFLDGFHRDVIIKSGITRGDLITEERYDELRKADRQHQLNDQIYRWLGVRNHSSGEIIKKSLAKGFTSGEARRALDPFIEKGYLDDALFAEIFTREKKDRYKWGPAKIRQALAQKGVKKQYIDSALESTFTEEHLIEALEAASRSARKRLMRTEPGLKRKKKLADFLLRRGFPGYLVMEKCDELLRKLENEEL
jgi:regulatory protein